MMPASQKAVAGLLQSRGRSRDALGAVLALAGEVAVLVLSFSSEVALPVTLAIHAAIVAGLGVFLFTGRERGSDLSMAATILLAVAVAGPAGAAVALAALPFYEGAFASPGAPPRILRDWYERLASAGRPAPATVIHDRIMSGRVPRLDTPAPLNFLHVIEHGTLDERQKALGLIARQFHPDYTAVLEAALKSTEPVVRVQAAAVVAHVKANLKLRIKHLYSERKDALGPVALLRISELQALQSCALVERREQVMCQEAAHEIFESSLAPGTDIPTVLSQTDAEAVTAIERFLMKSGRYRDLRVLHRVRKILSRRAVRLRRFPARQAA